VRAAPAARLFNSTPPHVVAGVFRIRSSLIAAVLCGALAPADAQTVCRDTPEGRVCTVEQALVSSTLVPVETQQELGLVTVAGGCSGTLVNRFWVLTADHCLTTDGNVNGPVAALSNVPITAAWSPRTVIPTRFVRNWGGAGVDLALVFLGAGDFGEARIQLFFVGELDTTMRVVKYGRGIHQLATVGPPPTPAVSDGRYRSAIFTPSAPSGTAYNLPTATAGESANAGDSGGPDFALAPNNVLLGIAGVQSSCGWTTVPGKPMPPTTWAWVDTIPGCSSAAIADARFDIVQIIQEGRIPCPDTSAACGVLETTALTIMLR
jgi:hypothetical protein